MNKEQPDEISDGWWEITIVFLVIMSVFGAAVLTLQDQPSLPDVVPQEPVAYPTRVPRPATPTPTKVATYEPLTGERPPDSVPETLPSSIAPRTRKPATPTPTPFMPKTMVGRTE